MFFKSKTKKLNRSDEHDLCVHTVENYQSPVKELCLSILPRRTDEQWDKGWFQVKEEAFERVVEFRRMYEVMKKLESEKDENPNSEIAQLKKLKDAAIAWSNLDADYDREYPPKAVTDLCDLIEEIDKDADSDPA